MYKILLVYLLLASTKLSAQISVINTGTNEHLRTIHKAGNSFVVSGVGNYLVKCLGECNTLISLNVPYTSLYPYYYFNLNRPDSNTLYLTAIDGFNYMIWKSSDCGVSWSKKFDTLYFPDPLASAYFDSLNGVSFCSNFKTIKTINGYSTFSVGIWPDNNPWFAVTDGDSSVIILSGTGGEGMSISHNRCVSWLPGYLVKGLNGEGINDVKFYNQDTIFAIPRHYSVNFDSSFTMSYNKGFLWKNKIFSPNYPITDPLKHTLRRLHVKSVAEIYILAQDNQNNEAVIFKTLDQGTSWQRYPLPFSNLLNDMAFINDSVALVSGNSGLLFKWNKIQATYTGITETSLENKHLGVFPNPVSDELTITMNTSTIQSNFIVLNLQDVAGKVLKSTSLDTKRKVHKIDIKDFPPGLYFLNTTIEEKTYSLKILKE